MFIRKIFSPIGLLIILNLISCKDEIENKPVITDIKNVQTHFVEKDNIIEDKEDEIEAQKWLETSIKNCFKNFDGDMSRICTTRYIEYKNDAMGVGMSDGCGSCVSEEEFRKKWHGIYETDKAGLYSDLGFLICGQDWNNITANAKFLKKLDNKSFLFETTILDDGISNGCIKNIKVIKKENSFLIDDVIEK